MAVLRPAMAALLPLAMPRLPLAMAALLRPPPLALLPRPLAMALLRLPLLATALLRRLRALPPPPGPPRATAAPREARAGAWTRLGTRKGALQLALDTCAGPPGRGSTRAARHLVRQHGLLLRRPLPGLAEAAT